MLLLRNCRYVITPTEDGKVNVMENASVLINNGVIEKVGEVNDSRVDVVECGGIAIPSPFNAHTHLAMVMFRGLVDGLELQDWLKIIWSMERRLTDEAVLKGFELGLIESLMNGTAGVLDMYFNPNVIDLAEKYGVRVFEGPTFIDEFEDPRLTENRLRNLVAAAQGSRLVKPVLNMHSIYANSEDTLMRISELKEELGLRLHTHVSETRWEVYRIRDRYGAYPVEVLNKFKLLDSSTILVHLGWVTNWEIELILRSQATAVHCPSSNMKLATAGFFPIRELIRGSNVALGTDGPGTGDSLDLFKEMRLTVLLQRNNYWDAGVLTASEALTMATVNGYRAVGLRGGLIAPGYLGDITVLDTSNPSVNPLNRLNIINNLVFSFTGNAVKYVIINGEVAYGPHNRQKLIERALTLSSELNEFILSRLLH
ncbi:amidohydrolase [Caldivirga sp.]|uniref:amidohydrolase n=1 Tax=Caldivirga sp. TaxID=2080243 RepID=UPI003D1178F8